jgi:hypothetical protein
VDFRDGGDVMPRGMRADGEARACRSSRCKACRQGNQHA